VEEVLVVQYGPVEGVFIAECGLVSQIVFELFSAHVWWCNTCQCRQYPNWGGIQTASNKLQRVIRCYVQFLLCELLQQTGAAYSAALKTIARADVKMVKIAKADVKMVKIARADVKMVKIARADVKMVKIARADVKMVCWHPI